MSNTSQGVHLSTISLGKNFFPTQHLSNLKTNTISSSNIPTNCKSKHLLTRNIFCRILMIEIVSHIFRSVLCSFPYKLLAQRIFSNFFSTNFLCCLQKNVIWPHRNVYTHNERKNKAKCNRVVSVLFNLYQK